MPRRTGLLKIAITGDFAYRQYEPDLCEALRDIGVSVTELPVLERFGPIDLLNRAQRKYVFGPGVLNANRAVFRACQKARPEVLLAWRTPWLHPMTVRAIQRLGTRVVLYNNDDPFGPDRDFAIWRHFRRLIPEVDLCLSYRKVNIPEYLAAGARAVDLWRSSYNPKLHRPISLTPADRQRFECDAVFVGHAENDGRLRALEHLAASGLHLRLFGTGWDEVIEGGALAALKPILRLDGEDYVKAIAAARIGLVFLSGRNRDEYTRRCFEIPAIGTLMLAPRTSEMALLFEDGREAALYRNEAELVAQAQRYLADAPLRDRVAKAGRARVQRDGQDIISRARELLALVRRFGMIANEAPEPRRGET